MKFLKLIAFTALLVVFSLTAKADITIYGRGITSVDPVTGWITTVCGGPADRVCLTISTDNPCEYVVITDNGTYVAKQLKVLNHGNGATYK